MTTRLSIVFRYFFSPRFLNFRQSFHLETKTFSSICSRRTQVVNCTKYREEGLEVIFVEKEKAGKIDVILDSVRVWACFIYPTTLAPSSALIYVFPGSPR